MACKVHPLCRSYEVTKSHLFALLKALKSSSQDIQPVPFCIPDEIKRGKYRQLFHPDQMLTGKEDAVCQPSVNLGLCEGLQKYFY